MRWAFYGHKLSVIGYGRGWARAEGGGDQQRDPTCSSLGESLSSTGLRPLKLPYGLRGEPLSEGEEPDVSMGQM